mmetsp:Transcript_15699/g.27596  ORF Transcript_15699/g.27596 Transcript_15699/m.27596 type:complete len:220 (+) Transcript_15699:174-833(+)
MITNTSYHSYVSFFLCAFLLLLSRAGHAGLVLATLRAGPCSLFPLSTARRAHHRRRHFHRHQAQRNELVGRCRSGGHRHHAVAGRRGEEALSARCMISATKLLVCESAHTAALLVHAARRDGADQQQDGKRETHVAQDIGAEGQRRNSVLHRLTVIEPGELPTMVLAVEVHAATAICHTFAVGFILRSAFCCFCEVTGGACARVVTIGSTRLAARLVHS